MSLLRFLTLYLTPAFFFRFALGFSAFVHYRTLF
jgi:hypothetical protein